MIVFNRQAPIAGRPSWAAVALWVCAAACAIEPDESDVSRFGVAWDIERAGARSSCEQAGVQLVVIRSVHEDRVSEFEDVLACRMGAGETAALLGGAYQVTAVAVADDGTELGTSAPKTAELREGGDLVELEPFALSVP